MTRVARGGVVVHVMTRVGVGVIDGVGGGGRVHAIECIPWGGTKHATVGVFSHPLVDALILRMGQ